jgi:ubiquinone/menaquinone biosynthesis C-methylase UbiE
MPSDFTNPISLRKEQYKNDENLNSRISLHERFSINQNSWTRWVFELLNLEPGNEVIELGSGPGNLWLENLDLLPIKANITVSDLSVGMLQSARKKLTGHPSFQFAAWDAQYPALISNKFDLVIANHMLYHVPNIEKVLAGAARLLINNGVFCATTNGAQHLREIWLWVSQALPSRIDALEAFDSIYGFSLENGRGLLKKHFKEIEFIVREDELQITAVQPLVDFVASSSMMSKFEPNELKILREYLENKLKQENLLRVTKNSGMFIAAQPV